MALAPRTRLGPYDTLTLIGEGGMGEVYRAHDSRLGRDVAIKTSKESFDDRFLREARAIATLNHPNICTIYDIGPDYLVMEYVDGESLRDRLLRGRLPQDEALRIATQIGAALEAAHEHGIVHRDLKPSNVHIRPDGQVKVLDFGVAKIISRDASIETTRTATDTEAGLVVGTPAYMAPEQARGLAVDKRADIWAFGVVLWEMLTGRRPFEGETATDVLAAVVSKEPPWEDAPARLRPLLRRCLAKDSRHRLHDIADVHLWLEDTAEANPEPAQVPRRFFVGRIGLGLALLAIGLVAGSLVGSKSEPQAETPSLHFALLLPPGVTLANQIPAALSPDGTSLAFTASSPTSDNSLYVHSFQTGTTRRLAGATVGDGPFWSSSGKSLAFRYGSKLMRTELSGGSAVELCDAVGFSTGDWSASGTLLVSMSDGLWRLPETGGKPQRVTTVDSAQGEIAHLFPQFFPDGTRFLFFVDHSDTAKRGTYVGSLDEPSRRTLVMNVNSKVTYVPPTGRMPPVVVFATGQALVAQEFNPDTAILGGEPVTLVPAISRSSSVRNAANADFWVSRSGVLAFRSEDLDADGRLAWLDRGGTRIGQVPIEDRYSSFFLSPDARKITIDVRNESGLHDIKLYDVDRKVMEPQVSSPLNDYLAVWSPDGARLVFGSSRTGVAQLYVKAVGSAREDQLTFETIAKYPVQWTHDGKYILFRNQSAARNGYDLWALAIDGDRKPFPVVESDETKFTAQVSPDGRWLAYQSATEDNTEIYVDSFPTARTRIQVSNNGGRWPKWALNGKTLELFYVSTVDRMTLIALIPTANGIQASTPKELFPVNFPTDVTYPYDVTADGKRFLALEPIAGSTGGQIQVLTDWQMKLKPRD